MRVEAKFSRFQEMDKKEHILLDGTIQGDVDCRAFGASLENGHQFIAWHLRDDDEAGNALKIGDKVQVRFSPYDMSKGQIIFE